MKLLQNIWAEFRRGENIDTFATIVLAFGLAIVSLLGIAIGNWIAPITLAVLGLLAISALRTRHLVVEALRDISSSHPPRPIERSKLPPLRERGPAATEIIFAAHSLMASVLPELDFLEERMRSGCKLHFLLLDPSSPSLRSLNQIIKRPITRKEIQQSLDAVQDLKRMETTTPGKCEVRLAKACLPFAIEAFDPQLPTATMDLELLAYKMSKDDRPCLRLTRQADAKWFESYMSQYRQLWHDSA